MSTSTVLQPTRNHILVFVIIPSVVTILGCQGGIYIFSMPLSELIHTADEAFDSADAVILRGDTPEQIENADTKRQELYNTAIGLYLETAIKDINGVYAQRAHYEIAKIYTRYYQFDQSIEHYQAILKLADVGYYPSQAKEKIENIRKNREIVKEQFAKYHNTKIIFNKTSSEESFNSAAESLFLVAQAYEEMEDFLKAIRTYQRIVAEFPKHEKAPQAQFQIGNIYFYDLYDYTNAGGWGTFVAVVEKFPNTQEAKKTRLLLKKAENLLTEIKHLQDEIRRYRDKKSPKCSYSDRRGVGVPTLGKELDENRLAQTFQIIAKNWVDMCNYPRAIQTYKTLLKEIPNKKFVVADAFYNIANLHQQNKEYERAIHAYNKLFKKVPESLN